MAVSSLDVLDKAVGIKVDIRESGEHGGVEELISSIVGDTRGLPGVRGHPRKPLEPVQEEILQRGDLRRLAANANCGASRALRTIIAAMHVGLLV